MKKFKRYTVTSALPYANGPIHIGHLAGVYIPADIYCRYLRLHGEDVIFIGGSDEHGVPITIKARKESVSPQVIVDRYHGIIKKSFEDFGISFDIYSRTTNKTHFETASEFFKKLYDNGKFIEKTTEQYYDEEVKQFLADRYITGTCPHCSNDAAYGDQCEKCGTSLNATDLINPKSTLSGSKPVRKETMHWFLPLDKYEPWLRQWILEEHKDWKINVYGQCKSWLDQGLQPRAVSRDLDWGVPVPVEGATGKVLYVWFDAPIGYISATKELFENRRLRQAQPAISQAQPAVSTNSKSQILNPKSENWELYWKDSETKLVHFIGKDNIVFHCIVFPAMLMAEGSFLVPENVPANEFLNLEGEKISTSRNWAVWLHEYLIDFPGKQDVLRYALTANAPETKDNDFTWADFQARNNNELVAILGNFVNRALVLTQKYFDNKVPEITEETDYEKNINEETKRIKINIEYSIENYRFREALKEAMDLARLGNKYLADLEPWKLIKTDEARVKTILNFSLQIAANLSTIIEPFLPFTAEKLRSMLNIKKVKWDNIGENNPLSAGHLLGQPALLFDKIEDETITAQVEKLKQSKIDNQAETSPAVPQKTNISFDEFAKMDIRLGTILTAEKIAKTKKLMKLTIDTGIDKRTVVSGIAEYYKAEEIIGKRVTILANLAPREIKGILSHGMILMAENTDGTLCFISPEKNFNNGGLVK